jgi:hypothetical protein
MIFARKGCFCGELPAATIVNSRTRSAAVTLNVIPVRRIHRRTSLSPGNPKSDSFVSIIPLDMRVQQALDVLRIVGNEAVHPGQIDLRDNRETAESLFRLFNLIVDKMISEPKHIAEIYGSLPPEKLKGIEERDKPKP